MDRLRDWKNKITTSNVPSTHGRNDESARPKYQGKAENNHDDSKAEMDAALRRWERIKSSAAGRHENGPTTRSKSEDLNANALFHEVPQYKERLLPDGQEGRPRPYEYPPDAVMTGPSTRRNEEENRAADELFAGASKDQKPNQPVPSAKFTEASERLRSLAAEASALGKFPTVRQKGEDPAADAIFEGRTRC